MWQTNIFNQMYLIHDCLFLGIRIPLSLHKLVIFQQSGKHPSKEMAKVCDADKSGESSDSSSDSEFNKNSNGIDTTASNQSCGTIESSQTPENMESISESEKQKLNQEGCNDESELMKLRKQNWMSRSYSLQQMVFRYVYLLCNYMHFGDRGLRQTHIHTHATVLF